MIRFIDTYRHRFGVEAICRVLGETECGFITSRGYRAAKGRPASARTLRDRVLVEEIRRIHAANYGVYGIRKMWHAMTRAGWDIGRDQCARLMKLAEVSGVRRGRRPVTTVPGRGVDDRRDLVHRDFRAPGPSRLWVADITYVRTLTGFVYTAFVTDVYSRRIVGWSTRASLRTEDLPLEALEQALATARRDTAAQLVHHSDRGRQYVAVAYTDKLAEAGAKASVGSVGDSYDNALAETVNGLYKTELIYSRRWAGLEDVEMATLSWVHWWNTRRLHEALDYHTPQEVESAYWEALEASPELETV